VSTDVDGFRRGLIVTRTPLRLSFAGGGTDLPAFYLHDDGAVLSSAIDKYIYVTVKRHGGMFDEAVRINYSRSEKVEQISEIQNDIARECLRFLQVDPPIYVSTVGDMPASSGLGGSGAFAVGLLNGLHALLGERVSAGQLAEEASHIEMEVLGQPIGKQDQYAAAFGGLNLFRFRNDGTVTVEPQRVRNRFLTELFEHIVLFWTGHQRDAGSVLAEQQRRTDEKHESLCRMREQAIQLRDLLANHATVEEVGRMLHEGWLEKRGLASTITNPQIDAWYEEARAAGALGGKVAGAGGGGFLFLVVPPDRQPAVRTALEGLREVRVRPETHGSQVVLPYLHW
jgi:D-glycero-alpha-D-manno-heptose-7-phosphate kinase